jgi:hypothetical protein
MSLTEFASMPLSAAKDTPAGINFDWLGQSVRCPGNVATTGALRPGLRRLSPGHPRPTPQ